MKTYISVAAMALLMTASVSKAQTDDFAEQAQKLSSVLGLKYGENKDVQAKGTSDGGAACQVYITNKTAIDPTFPESSKSSQRIEILVQTKSQSSKFFLSRTSEVRDFDYQGRTGATTLYVRADNKTGIGNRRMTQEAQITRASNAYRTLALKITDFDGKAVTCTLSKK